MGIEVSCDACSKEKTSAVYCESCADMPAANTVEQGAVEDVVVAIMRQKPEDALMALYLVFRDHSQASAIHDWIDQARRRT
jgi:hypothetical protein